MLTIDLSGRLAFTTASSKGIGFGVARTLAKAGADVVLLSRSEENLKKAREKIKAESDVDVHYIAADLTKREDLERTVKELEDIGEPDTFFFSTGGPKPGYFMEMSMEDWEKAVDLLLYPAVYLTRALVPAMKRRGFGRIVYSTSVAIKEPIPNIALSNVVRISMAGLVRTLAKELGPKGITVNGIMPGIIRTDRMIQLARDRAEREGKTVEEALREYARPIPLGRLGEPEEIGYLVAFLASELGAYINGAMIPVDGGRLNSVF
ncbi:SDR family oxidoreductase [Thermococcus celer]|uniref:Short-chain dehydrogenase n=1 Tax=Thermococcus celer Vu 13 = JCM 8558 TaxID=1293037 RepID=A0A218P141_THECE|nr:SDR family oxidoreductase [Thermococcus celer]ASI98627.1 short-chain dehydrogenase [Thermococcus celer Vu 13 = JCM 8558]